MAICLLQQCSANIRMLYYCTVETVDSVLPFITHNVAIYPLILEVEVLEEIFEYVEHSGHLKQIDVFLVWASQVRG